MSLCLKSPKPNATSVFSSDGSGFIRQGNPEKQKEIDTDRDRERFMDLYLLILSNWLTGFWVLANAYFSGQAGSLEAQLTFHIAVVK